MSRNYIQEETEMQAVLGLLKLKDADKNDGKKSTYQCLVLRRIFDIIKYPSQQTQKDLAIILRLSHKSIRLWFQNERQSTNKVNLKDNFVGFEISPVILYRICRDVNMDMNS